VALGALETAVGDDVVPVESVVVDVVEEDEVDELDVEPLVVETASWPRDVSTQPIIEINVSNKMNRCLIGRGARKPPEPRLEQKTRNRFVMLE
jgi:hypothetical protein